MKTKYSVLPATLLCLAGCSSLQEYQASGNAIIIARYDTRYPSGGETRLVTDNAGGFPSLVANAAGVSTTPAGGAALNIGAAAIANFVAGEAAKGKITVAFKYLFENTCKYGIIYVDLKDTPSAEKLYPGYIGKWTPGRDSRNWGLVPDVDGEGRQTYLSKSHPCYSTWVTEWKEHQRVVLASKGRDWDRHRAPIAVLFAKDVPIESIPNPDLAWVK